MTTEQILTLVSIYSNEVLREIVAGKLHRKNRSIRFYAERELAKRDQIATFGK